MSAVTIEGAELHYDDLGEGTDVLVWGHGYLARAELYRELIDRMPGHRHIAVDFRGHGRSAGVTDSCSVGRMADDVFALVTVLGIDRFGYIGHSMGNAVGLRLASRHPEAVRVAVSMAGVPADGMPESCRPLTDGIAGLQGDEAGLTAALGHLLAHDGMDTMIEAMGRSAALVAPGPLTAIARTELYLDESADILPGLTQPWLFLIPGDDLAVPADAQLATARAIPGARAAWFNGEGHLMPQERPAETAATLRAFLDNLPAAS